MTKHRLSASVDADLFLAAERAVSEGLAENVSVWVNSAMRLKLVHDQRMRALDDFVSAYEDAHGVITDEEMALAARRARAEAVVVRPQKKPAQARRTAPASTRRASGRQ